jgi:shikimate 5-dehydrogenase
VNTTPVGTAPHAADTPLPAEALAGGTTVYDLVYNPARTRLLRDAEAAGCRTIGGLDMLVAQAVRQFEWWCGTRPSTDLFLRAARAALASRNETAQEAPA